MTPLRLNQLDLVLLTLLAEKSRHGYELTHIGISGAPSSSSIYHSLHKLERYGLVTGRWQLGSLAPNRRRYRLSSQGNRFAHQDSAAYALLLHRRNQQLLASYRDTQAQLAALGRLKQVHAYNSPPRALSG